MPEPRVDAKRLLYGEALLRSTLLVALAAALLLSSVPLAPVLLAVAAAASVRAGHRSVSAIRGRALCWNGEWYWDSEPHGDGKPGAEQPCPEESREDCQDECEEERRNYRAEPLSTVEHARVCFGFLLLRVAGPDSRIQVMVCMPLLDRETRRGLLLACRRAGAGLAR